MVILSSAGLKNITLYCGYIVDLALENIIFLLCIVQPHVKVAPQQCQLSPGTKTDQSSPSLCIILPLLH